MIDQGKQPVESGPFIAFEVADDGMSGGASDASGARHTLDAVVIDKKHARGPNHLFGRRFRRGAERALKIEEDGSRPVGFIHDDGGMDRPRLRPPDAMLAIDAFALETVDHEPR